MAMIKMADHSGDAAAGGTPDVVVQMMIAAYLGDEPRPGYVVGVAHPLLDVLVMPEQADIEPLEHAPRAGHARAQRRRRRRPARRRPSDPDASIDAATAADFLQSIPNLSRRERRELEAIAAGREPRRRRGP